jgi:hypothetical protein
MAQRVSVWKLLGAFFLIPALCTLVPLAFSQYGLINPLNAKAGLLLAVTALGLCFKIVCGDLATGAFDYHKNGHDFCILTMGGALSAGSLQLIKETDLFPGIPNAWPWSYLPELTEDVVQQRLIVIGAVFALSCVFAVLTAMVSRSVKEDKPRYSALLSLLNFSLGLALFASYLLLLITKE